MFFDLTDRLNPVIVHLPIMVHSLAYLTDQMPEPASMELINKELEFPRSGYSFKTNTMKFKDYEKNG